MKIERLLGILAILQQKGKVTTPYLAARFEVSRRTIQRDIEEICRAGIPLVTTQGPDGGVAIMDGFALDTTVFSKDELELIFAGIKSLDSVSKHPRADIVAAKMGKLEDDTETISICLSSFYDDRLSDMITQLKQAAEEQMCVRFRYFYKKGEAEKIVEPYRLLFHWSNWYLFGFCRERRDFRIYKLRRLCDLEILEEHFERREIPPEKLKYGIEAMTDDKVVAATFSACETYRLVEERGPQSFVKLEDGRLYTEWGFSNYAYALQWFLSFGSRVEINGPEEFLALYREEIERIRESYF